MKALAAPHSVDSIPTSANQEDYVSMGMGAARRLQPMLANLRNILAIELLAACQGIDFLAPLRTGAEAQKAYDIVRSISKTVDADRSLAPDIEAVAISDRQCKLQQASVRYLSISRVPGISLRSPRLCGESYCDRHRDETGTQILTAETQRTNNYDRDWNRNRPKRAPTAYLNGAVPSE